MYCPEAVTVDAASMIVYKKRVVLFIIILSCEARLVAQHSCCANAKLNMNVEPLLSHQNQPLGVDKAPGVQPVKINSAWQARGATFMLRTC
jgi:hypothetical protein